MDVRHRWLTWNLTDHIGLGSNDCGCGTPFWTYSASSFSPDGSHLVFTSDAPAVGTNLDIWKVPRCTAAASA
jgi:WD40-like Beta Propeller Repeat